MEAEKAVGDSMLLAPFLPFPSSGWGWRPPGHGREGHKERTAPCGHVHVSVCKQGALLSAFQGALGSLDPSSQRLPCMEHELR